MSKQREALELARAATPHDQLITELLDSRIPKTEREHAAAREIKRLREALAEPEQELEFWPGEILVCKEDDSKVTVVNGNRGSLQLMNGKIAIAWSDTVGGEYTIEQIKEMFYRTEKPEQDAPPAREPLTDREITSLMINNDFDSAYRDRIHSLIRAVELTHGIGEA